MNEFCCFRTPRDKYEGIPQIPAVSVSWGEAQRLLNLLAGPIAPSSIGGKYRLGGHFKQVSKPAINYDVKCWVNL